MTRTPVTRKPTGDQGTVVADRRREERSPANDPATVEMPLGVRVSATVIDISRSGMRLELEKPLDIGMKIGISIQVRKLMVIGDVRYCRRSGERYHAGIAIRGENTAEDSQAHTAGRSLTADEVLRIKGHLLGCDVCVERLANAMGIQEPVRRRREEPQ